MGPQAESERKRRCLEGPSQKKNAKKLLLSEKPRHHRCQTPSAPVVEWGICREEKRQPKQLGGKERSNQMNIEPRTTVEILEGKKWVGFWSFRAEKVRGGEF